MVSILFLVAIYVFISIFGNVADCQVAEEIKPLRVVCQSHSEDSSESDSDDAHVWDSGIFAGFTSVELPKDNRKPFSKIHGVLSERSTDEQFIEIEDYISSIEIGLQAMQRHALRSHLSAMTTQISFSVQILRQSFNRIREMFHKEASAERTEFYKSSLQDLKNVIKDKTLLNFIPIDDEINDKNRIDFSELFQLAGLKTVDFLLNHQLVIKEDVRSIFQDFELAGEVVRYVYHRFRQDIQASILEGSPYITLRWFWPLMHTSFQALEEQENTIIHTRLVLWRLETISKKLPEYYTQSKEWLAFVNSFDESYFYKRNPNDNRAVAQNQFDINKIINVLLMPSDPSHDGGLDLVREKLDKVLVNILDLSEYSSRRTLGNHPRAKEFHNRYKLIMYNSKINEDIENASRCIQYAHQLYPKNLIQQDYYPKTYNRYMNELEGLIGSFKKLIDDVKKKDVSTSTWLEKQQFFKTFSYEAKLSTINELKAKSPNFWL